MPNATHCVIAVRILRSHFEKCFRRRRPRKAQKTQAPVAEAGEPEHALQLRIPVVDLDQANPLVLDRAIERLVFIGANLDREPTVLVGLHEQHKIGLLFRGQTVHRLHVSVLAYSSSCNPISLGQFL